MSWGEGAIWEPVMPNGMLKSSDDSGPVNFELTVRVGQTTKTGVVQIQVNTGDTFDTMAAKLASEWNTRNPIEGIFAVAQEATTAFFPTGELARLDPSGKPMSEVLAMAATFPGEPREPLNPVAVWETGKIQLRRDTITFVTTVIAGG